MTAGIVSAKGRSLPTEQNENYVPFIQTDVAINPGNSGGPLFNLDGEVVGINSQIYSNSGGFMGVSFAIPIDIAMEVVDQLRKDGRVARGWLGVVIQEVNRDLAESFGLKRPHGALVSRVLENSPAETGGILEGDIITAINDQAIDFSSELPHYVGRIRPGSKARMDVVRAGKEIELKVEIGELADRGEETLGRRSDSGGGSSRLGLTIEAIPANVLERLSIEGGVQGHGSRWGCRRKRNPARRHHHQARQPTRAGLRELSGHIRLAATRSFGGRAGRSRPIAHIPGDACAGK